MLLHDRSKEQVSKGLALIDKLLAKDVGKGRLTDLQAKEARERISVIDGIEGFRDVDMVVEVRTLDFQCLPLVQTVIDTNYRLCQNLCR